MRNWQKKKTRIKEFYLYVSIKETKSNRKYGNNIHMNMFRRRNAWYNYSCPSTISLFSLTRLSISLKFPTAFVNILLFANFPPPLFLNPISLICNCPLLSFLCIFCVLLKKIMTVVFYLLLFLIILNENETKKMNVKIMMMMMMMKKKAKWMQKTRQVSIRWNVAELNVFFICCCWSMSPKNTHTQTRTFTEAYSIYKTDSICLLYI